MRRKKKSKPAPPSSGETIAPEPAAWLSDYAKEVWRATIADLEAEGRQLGRLNTQAFAAFCDAAGLVRECGEVLAREGMTVDGGREGKKRHPAVTTRISALNALRAYAGELGLTPGTVARLPEPAGNPGRFPHELVEAGHFTKAEVEAYREKFGEYPTNEFHWFKL